MIAPLALVLALLAPPDAAQPHAGADAPTCAPQEGGACDPEVRAKTLALLGAMDRPVRPETWRALGPGAEPVLAEVAASDGLPSRRALALEGLAALGGARAEALHRSVARDEHEPRAVRRAAVRGLGRLVPA
jgi:HEAT repeat protein